MRNICTEEELKRSKESKASFVEMPVDIESYLTLQAMAPDQEVSQTLEDLVAWYTYECKEIMPEDYHRESR